MTFSMSFIVNMCIALFLNILLLAESIVANSTTPLNSEITDDYTDRPDQGENEQVDHFNPFTYEQWWVVVLGMIVGSLVLMALVLLTVVAVGRFRVPRMPSGSDPPYSRDIKESPDSRRKKKKKNMKKLQHQVSLRESTLELPKQDSLELDSGVSGGFGNVELDNDSFLASLENVSISIVPPPPTPADHRGWGNSPEGRHSGPM